MNSDPRYSLLITTSPFLCHITNTNSWLKPRLLTKYHLLAENSLPVPKNESDLRQTVEEEGQARGQDSLYAFSGPQFLISQAKGIDHMLSGLLCHCTQSVVDFSASPITMPECCTRARCWLCGQPQATFGRGAVAIVPDFGGKAVHYF